jgi:spermidine synthase
MYPEALTCSERTTFLEGIFSRVEKSLNPNGVLSLQCCSEFDGETSALLEQILSRRFKQLEFRKCFIPSFCENWVFGSARLMQPSTADSVRHASPDRAANLPL